MNKAIGTSVYINKFQNYKYKHDDFYYFVCENNPMFHYKHYSSLIFPEVVTDNYIEFNKTTQRIKYTDIFKKTSELQSIMFNFIIEAEKKSIDINSTLFSTSDNNSYIKLFYDNQGIIFRIDDMYKSYPSVHFKEIIIPTTDTLLNKQCVISLCCHMNETSLSKIVVFVNDNKIYDSTFLLNGSMSIHQYHEFYLCNYTDNSQSFNGNFYDYSCL